MVTVTSGSDSATATITFPAIAKGQLVAPGHLQLVLESVSFDSFDVTFDAVPGANGYRATATALGGTAITGVINLTSASFTGLSESTTYTIRVQATGDDVNWEALGDTTLRAFSTNARPGTGLPEMIGWTLKIEDLGSPPETGYWWSGEGTITVGSQAYQGCDC